MYDIAQFCYAVKKMIGVKANAKAANLQPPATSFLLNKFYPNPSVKKIGNTLFYLQKNARHYRQADCKFVSTDLK